MNSRNFQSPATLDEQLKQSDELAMLKLNISFRNNREMRPFLSIISSFMMASMLTACAFDLAHVDQAPAALRLITPATQAFVLEQDVPINLPFGYNRVLKQRSTWRYFGTVEAGNVYMTRDQVLTVEVSNIHEAYIVLSDGRLVGFYLPVERTFSPLRNAVTLPLREKL